MISSKLRAAAVAATVFCISSSAEVGAQILRGSEASVLRMYQYASRNNFEFYPNASAIRAAVSSGTLVELRANADYELHQVSYPFVMPEVKLFVERLASQYRVACGEKLVVTSAMRPQSMRLSNASDRSVHSTGMAVDLRSANIPAKCVRWLRDVLEHLERSAVIEATEERNPPHFHVAVFPAPYQRYVSNQSAAVAVASPAELESAVSGPSGGGELQFVPYTVRSGDSLWRIASRFDTSIKALQDVNKLRSDVIRPGQTLLIPSYAGPR